MAGRASWKGYLRLSLVTCPVKLYPATSSTAGKISFNLLHKDTLNRVQQKYHDPELGEIDRADLVKGYQFEKDRYVVVSNEEMDEIEIESSKTIDIDGFVDAGDILEGDLVLVPGEHARTALAEVERALAGHADLLAEEEVEDQQEETDGQEADQRGGRARESPSRLEILAE